MVRPYRLKPVKHAKRVRARKRRWKRGRRIVKYGGRRSRWAARRA